MRSNSIHIFNTLKAGIISSILSSAINYGLFYYGQQNNAFGNGFPIGTLMNAPIDLITIIAVSAAFPILAAIFYWIESKIFSHPKIVFFILAILVYGVFTLGPLQYLKNGTNLTLYLLETMHAIVALLTVIFMFTVGSKD